LEYFVGIVAGSNPIPRLKGYNLKRSKYENNGFFM